MPRLRRSDVSRPGIVRVRAGRGFSYRDATGSRIDDPVVIDRIRALAIPPAWDDVWVSPHSNGHIQAVGTDDAGRRQYLYHAAWRERKDREKFERMLELAASLPTARRSVTLDLKRCATDPSAALDRAVVLAAAFRMLDSGSLRVGSEQYAAGNGSYGLSTLLCAHVAVTGDRVVTLRFPAKSGQEWKSEIDDALLALIVRRLKRRGSRARLLAWRDGAGWHRVSASEINDDLRRRTGGDFTAKDFRTLQGTVAAARELAVQGPQTTPTARRRAIARAVAAAAETLGNTPAIARSSYIDPRVIDRFDQGLTIRVGGRASIESALCEFLRD
ncbi:MAG: DNA topoisomerase IB [Microcella sp.]|uniref:DNA topoisomerase IB n=1 Tax=Microcella sp. TaxID=1913979 RepID=UPI0024C75FBC|nr:DNA topoisomerase IB [Microcella sp.]UYN83297.1 MAG: DNA topoisomerase IB [Microcella sp.]